MSVNACFVLGFRRRDCWPGSALILAAGSSLIAGHEPVQLGVPSVPLCLTAAAVTVKYCPCCRDVLLFDIGQNMLSD